MEARTRQKLRRNSRFKNSFWQSPKRWHLFQKEEPLLCPTRSRSQRASLLYALWLVWPLEAKRPWPVSLGAWKAKKQVPTSEASVPSSLGVPACSPDRLVEFKKEGSFVKGIYAELQEPAGNGVVGWGEQPSQQALLSACHLSRGPRLHLPNGILWCQGWAPCHSSLQEHLSRAGCQVQSSLWPLGIS